MSSLHNQLAAAESEDVARAIRILLRSPLVTQAVDADAFDLVRRRQQPLRAWFDYHCGWTLLVEPRLGYARLVKIGTDQDASRPARRLRAGRAPFDRRRYTLLCVVAAELLDTPITTIGLLAERVTQACGLDDVLPDFDTSRRPERMAFVDALLLLEHLGALEVLDGASDSYVDGESAKVLYQVNTTLLVRLLAAPRSPSTLQVPAAEVPVRFDELLNRLGHETRYGAPVEAEDRADASVVGTSVPDPMAGPDSGSNTGSTSISDPPGSVVGSPRTVTDVRRNLWLRHSLLRRLLDEPVVHLEDLAPEQREYAATLTGRQVIRRAAAQAGFVLEERAEGYLLVDPDALATDTTFPDSGSTAKVAALLLLDDLVGAAHPMTRSELTLAAGQTLQRFPAWAKAYREQDGARRLTEDGLEVLEAFRLVRRDGTLVRALPAAARYVVSVSTSELPAAHGAPDSPSPREDEPHDQSRVDLGPSKDETQDAAPRSAHDVGGRSDPKRLHSTSRGPAQEVLW